MAPDRVRQQQFADALTARPLVTRQATDQGSGNGIIARQLARHFFRQIPDAERKTAEAVEADDAKGVIGDDEDASDITPLVLGRAPLKPIIEFRLPATKCRPVMMLSERLNDATHPVSPSIADVAEAPKSTFRWVPEDAARRRGTRRGRRQIISCVDVHREPAARLHRRDHPPSVH
jgi:hypothetical protein